MKIVAMPWANNKNTPMYIHAHPRRTCMKEKHLQHKVISSHSVTYWIQINCKSAYATVGSKSQMAWLSLQLVCLWFGPECTLWETQSHTFFNALALGIAVAGGIMCSGCLTIHLLVPFLWTHYVTNTVTEMFQILTWGRSKVRVAVPSYPSLCCEHFGINAFVTYI